MRFLQILLQEAGVDPGYAMWVQSHLLDLENSHDGAIGCMPMPHFKMDFAPPLKQREGEKERKTENRERMGRNKKEEEE